MKRKVLIFGLALTLAFTVSGAQQAPHSRESDDIAVIVNVANPVNEVSLPELRRMLMGERRFWKGNVQVRLVLRAPGARERDSVLARLLQADNKAFAEHWRAKVFRGEASEEPLSVPSAAMAEQYLLEVPGGLTFMAARNPPAKLKILKLDGKLPGEPGYALK